MKKVKLATSLSLMFLTLSCSTPDVESCTSCKEVEEQFINNEWRTVGREYPTAFNCASNGYTFDTGGYLSGTGQYISKRRVVVCK
jgi:hypothetical protein